MRCQRQAGDRQGWWFCKHCETNWSESNTGHFWRPYLCPDRNGKDNGSEAYRHKENHHGGGR